MRPDFVTCSPVRVFYMSSFEQRTNAPRALENNFDFMEGMLLGGDKAGISEKQLPHREWTKDPLPDDFDDTDLD